MDPVSNSSSSTVNLDRLKSPEQMKMNEQFLRGTTSSEEERIFTKPRQSGSSLSKQLAIASTSTASEEERLYLKPGLSGTYLPNRQLSATRQKSVTRQPSVGSPIPLTKTPMVLMKINESTKKLEVNNEALSWLNLQEKQIAVTSIVGPTGLGKSYLLNELMGQSEGFAYENNIDGTTRGIWIWGMEHPWKRNQILLLMDTEGQQDVQRDDAYDESIALMTMLLSSVMIFNITKKIGSDLIKQLGALVGHAKQIHINDKDTDDIQNISKYLPVLIVLVRDFQCNLNFRGAEVTPDRYLEQCLQDKEAESDTWLDRGKIFAGFKKPREKNGLNQLISDMFPPSKRYCRVLPCPFFDYSKVKLPPGVPEFEAGVNELKQLIARVAKPKVFVKTDAVDGRLFAILVRKYADILNKGEVVCIQPTYTLIAKEENSRLLAEGTALYKERMNKLSFPMTNNEFTDQHTRISQEVAAKLIRKVIFDNAANFRESLQAKLVEIYNEMNVMNENASYKKCEEILTELHRTISEKLENQEYYCAGGYDAYKEDMEKLKKEYAMTNRKGVKSDEVLLKFLSEKEPERTLIITADTKMTALKIQEEANERLEEERKIREEQRKKEQQENKEKIETLMKQMEELKDSFDREREERERLFEEQLEAQKKQLQTYEEQMKDMQRPKCNIL